MRFLKNTWGDYRVTATRRSPKSADESNASAADNARIVVEALDLQVVWLNTVDASC